METIDANQVEIHTKLDHNFDIIVVGAGPGGSAIGALLAKQGYKVLMVDKNPRAGGRMMTIHKDGFHYELFPINCVPQQNSHFEYILREIGKEDEVEVIQPKDLGMILYEDIDGEIRKWNMKTTQVFKMLKTLGINLFNFKEVFQSFKVLGKLSRISFKEIEKLYDVSSMDFMKQFNIPKGLYTYLLAAFGEGAFEMTADRSSAAEMLKVFQNAMKNGGGRYYKNGVGHVFEVFARAVQDFGGTVLYDTRVKKINVENGKVVGITTKDDEDYYADVVVSNAGLRQTVLKLIGEKHFSTEYLDWIKNLENNLACVGYRWVLSKPVLEYSTYVYFPEGCVSKYDEFIKMAEGKKKPDKSYIYLGTTSVYPGLAPEGKQLVYACMSCLPDPEIDIQPYLDYVEEKVKIILPELFDHIEKTEVFGPKNVSSVGTDRILPGQGGEAYGLALSVGQTGEKQPKGDSPIEGLFHVGCDAGGSGIGTHQALDSALNVLELIIKEKNKK